MSTPTWLVVYGWININNTFLALRGDLWGTSDGTGNAMNERKEPAVYKYCQFCCKCPIAWILARLTCMVCWICKNVSHDTSSNISVHVSLNLKTFLKSSVLETVLSVKSLITWLCYSFTSGSFFYESDILS